jgi:CubicO group peptidase (beta-lactamase class C family)
VGRATGESPLDLFDRLVADPLKMSAYAWPLSPAGQPYGGGGVQLLPRDFLKIAQMMLDGGTWGAHRVVGRDFAKTASSALHDLNGIQYGYLWWSIAYPYKDRIVHAFFAAGAGGQSVMGVPELGLAVAIFAGNYLDPVSFRIQQEFIPNYLLSAVREAGDDPSATIKDGNFVTPWR